MIPSLYEIGYIVKFKEGDQALYRTPFPLFRAVEDNYHVVSEQDTLLSLAQRYYNDQMLWYIIADANPDSITDIFSLTENTTLFIPSLDLIKLMYG